MMTSGVTSSTDVPELVECTASPPYDAVIVTDATDDDAVYVIVQVALPPEPERAHEPESLNVPPAPPSSHDTVSVGVDGNEVLSVTVTVYTMLLFRLSDDGLGSTVVVVQSTGLFPDIVPEIIPSPHLVTIPELFTVP
jgi:hypothetical protein